MPLRIAFDLDGVLADMDSELRRQAEILFGQKFERTVEPAGATPDAAVPAVDDLSEVIPDPIAAPFGVELSRRQASRLWRHVESISDFWGTLKEIEPGAVARLGTLAAERRWEVIFLTKRPESAGATAQVQSQRWLEAHGYPLPSVFVVQGSRGRVAAALALDIVVDDRPENCLDVVADSAAHAILVWRDAGKTVPAAAARLGIGVARSVGECLDILTDVDTPAEKQGFIDRVMQLFGLKGEATARPDPPASPARSRRPTLN